MQTEPQIFLYCLLLVDWNHVPGLCCHCLLGNDSGVDMCSAFWLYLIETDISGLLNAAVVLLDRRW